MATELTLAGIAGLVVTIVVALLWARRQGVKARDADIEIATLKEEERINQVQEEIRQKYEKEIANTPDDWPSINNMLQ